MDIEAHNEGDQTMENENQFGNIRQGTVIGNINDKEFEARMKKVQAESERRGS